MPNRPVDVLLVAVGGYGAQYVERMPSLEKAGVARIVGVIDPMAKQSPAWPALAATGIKAWDSMDAIRDGHIQADLAVISSPIAFHAEQSCTAQESGMHVLCEKPLAATIADGVRMARAHRVAGANGAPRIMEIGYQWSFSPAIQTLKKDITAGRFGAPRRFATMVSWPRTNVYYNRNNWAGAITDPAGRVVNDSPVGNATAHYLHNMLYLLGDSPDTSAFPVSIQAECYRANPIQNYDSACCRARTDSDVEVLFYAAHCVEHTAGPIFRFEFDDATVDYTNGGTIVAGHRDDIIHDYGNPFDDDPRKLDVVVAGCQDPDGYQATCPPEAALPLTVCVEALQSVPVSEFESTQLSVSAVAPGEELTFLPGLDTQMTRAFADGQLYSELGLPWATPATRIDLARPAIDP